MDSFGFFLALMFEHAGRSASGIVINLAHSRLPATWRLCEDEPYIFASISTLSLLQLTIRTTPTLSKWKPR
jgi:hypothetical protein